MLYSIIKLLRDSDDKLCARLCARIISKHREVTFNYVAALVCFLAGTGFGIAGFWFRELALLSYLFIFFGLMFTLNGRVEELYEIRYKDALIAYLKSEAEKYEEEDEEESKEEDERES